MSDELVKVFSAPDAVVGGMIEELLRDAGFETVTRADDFLGISGQSMHPQILCRVENYEEIRDFLVEKGFIKGD